MNRTSRLNIIGIVGMLLLVLPSCRKEWLEAKPDKSLLVPATVRDYQLLLDNSNLFNTQQGVGLGEVGAGDFYISNEGWPLITTNQERAAYIWAPTNNFYITEISIDWENGYKRILSANVILNGIEKIVPSTAEQAEWNTVKGSALFFRAFNFFNLAQEYCVQYKSNTASQQLGLPLRLKHDINIQLKRSTLLQTYQQIIADLKLAADLLKSTPQFKTRPSKEAAYALLARTCLAMEDYSNAGRYAELALQIQSELLDYSNLNTAAAFPLSRFNEEVIFHSTFYYGIFNPSRMYVVPELYGQYVPGDIRKTAFFTANGMSYKGSYNGDRNLFGGLATSELYLIRAEANARKGNLPEALADLNRLRRNRWAGVYTDLSSADPEVVLDYVISERRRELLFRGVRWSDVRRLNGDSRFAVTLTRSINGNTYVLPPNDKRYVLPIDEEEIRIAGILQNER